MLLHTFAWRNGIGWSAPWPSDMDSPSTLAVIFGGSSPSACRSALAEVAGRLPRSVLLGCSTAGEVAGTHVDDDSLAVALARFDNVRLRRAALPIASQRDSFATGQALGQALLSPDLRAVIVLCDGLHVNGTQLVGGINQVLPDHVIVTGGLAGDGERFGSTWVLVGADALDHYVTAVGFYGESLRIGHGCDAGWSSFGPERHVTRAQGNVLHELDGRPPLALYRSYLGERAEGLPATAMLFPLSIRRGLDDTHPLIRTILGIDEAAQSMTFAGDIPTGYLARLMLTNTERLIESAGHAARAAAQSFPATAIPLALSVSCVGRRLCSVSGPTKRSKASLPSCRRVPVRWAFIPTVRCRRAWPAAAICTTRP